jgi:hypothetical protein
MALRSLLLFIAGFSAASTASAAAPAADARPAPRPHVLTIEGQNTVTFVPAAGLDPIPIDYRARVEYRVYVRTDLDAEPTGRGTSKKNTRRKPATSTRPNQGRADGAKAVAGIGVAMHAVEIRFRQQGQTVLESRISRARFQGRFQPGSPILSVSYNEAPPALQDTLKKFDTTAAFVLIDEQSRVIERTIKVEGSLEPIVETLLSIHTPIPRDAATWEAPTQLAMGHGQTAKGTLRFEKDKASFDRTVGLVTAKVSGVLSAKGVVAGNLIKDGTYTVKGEQTYDPRSRSWTSARWQVAVENELANAAGTTVAHSRGQMTVDSKAVESRGEGSKPKP